MQRDEELAYVCIAALLPGTALSPLASQLCVHAHTVENLCQGSCSGSLGEHLLQGCSACTWLLCCSECCKAVRSESMDCRNEFQPQLVAWAQASVTPTGLPQDHVAALAVLGLLYVLCHRFLAWASTTSLPSSHHAVMCCHISFIIFLVVPGTVYLTAKKNECAHCTMYQVTAPTSLHISSLRNQWCKNS